MLGRAAVRLGLPALVGELLTGMLLGPSLLGHLAPGSPAGCCRRTVGWLLLALVSALATGGLSAGVVTGSVLRPVAVVLVAVLAGRRLVGAVLRLATRSGGAGPSVADTVVLVLLGAAGTQSLGLEAVLGAIVTSLTAPPILRLGMARVEQTADERPREVAYGSWSQPSTAEPTPTDPATADPAATPPCAAPAAPGPRTSAAPPAPRR